MPSGGRLPVLLVADVPPTRDPDRGSGSSLILDELLAHRPDDVDLTVVAPEAVDGPGQAVATVRADDGTWRAALRRIRSGAAAPLLGPGALADLRRLAGDAAVTYLHGPECVRLVPHLVPVGPVVCSPLDAFSRHHRLAASRAGSAVDRASSMIRSIRAARAESRCRDAMVILVSEAEVAEWERRHGGSTVAIPIGFHPTTEPWAGATASTILFAGSLDYPPNIESATIMARDVFPDVRAVVPEAQLALVGRRPTEAVLGLRGDGVSVLADVPSMDEHYRAAAVAAFPGHLGSGVRDCVLEALVQGCPVVASPHSARSIPSGDHLVVADDAAMAVALSALLLDRDQLRARSAAARRFGATLPSPATMAARYWEVIRASAR